MAFHVPVMKPHIALRAKPHPSLIVLKDNGYPPFSWLSSGLYGMDVDYTIVTQINVVSRQASLASFFLASFFLASEKLNPVTLEG